MTAFGIQLFVFALLTVQAPKSPPVDDAKTDYEARLNDILALGVTPDTNANALLWQVFGPTPEGGRMPVEYFKRLGIPEPPKEGDYFQGIYKYGKERLSLTDNQFEGLFDQQSLARERQWTAKDYPAIAEWLKFNQKPLEVAVEATKRPAYYNPLISRKDEKGQGSLIGALLPTVQKCRELVTALTARSMLRLGEGKPDEAWQDLLAAHRLGRLVARGGTLIEGLVGIAIDAIAANSEVAYLAHARLTSKQILDRLKDLQKLPPMQSMADKIDTAERHMFLETLQFVRRGGLSQVEVLADGGVTNAKATAEELKALAKLDWQPAIKNGNAYYDRMTAAMRLPDRAAREKALDKIEEELVKLKSQALKPADIGAQLATGKDPGKNVSKAISDTLISLLIPAVRKVQQAHDRSVQIDRNLHVAFALAAYRADNGRYPVKLADLAPKYLDAVPNDSFSGKPLIYKPSEKGYLVYSVGPNGIDEGGRWYDDMPPGDDPRVRMPLPEKKK